MEAKTFLILPILLTCGWASAQTVAPSTPPPQDYPSKAGSPSMPPPLPHVVDVPQPEHPSASAAASGATPGDNLDPAKVAEYQKRFEAGYALELAGKLLEARAIYDGILADEPQAKRSLLEAGKISFKLGESAKADDYLERLHEIVPDFPEAIELLIQINQALTRDVKVELLIREFRELHDSGKIPELSQSLCFVRERFQVDQQNIVVSQFFDYTRDPNTVWMAEVFDLTGQLKRRVLLNYDPDSTRALRAKDAKYATTEVFTWFEHVMKDQRVTEIDAYLQIFALPDYAKFRSAMLIILANPPKPIYTAPVDAAKP